MHRSRRNSDRRLKSIVFLALWIVLAIVASACAGDDNRDVESEVNEDANKSVTLAIGVEPINMDFIIAEDPQRDIFARGNVFQSLTFRQSSDMSIQPMLATEWEPDGDKSWVFHLREGVTWHDGTPFTADDVVATIEQIIDPDSGAEQTAGLIGSVVAGATAIDDATVSIQTASSDPALPARMSLIGIAKADTTSEDRTETMVGTGPYQMVEWAKSDHISLTAYPGYWGDAPIHESVEIKFIPEDSVRVSALQAGEVQLARSLSPELAETAPKAVSAPESLVSILRLNAKDGVLTDVRLRKAINLAIDRDSLIQNVYGGYARDSQGQPFASFVFGFDPTLQGYEYNLEEARALVKEAGAEGTEIRLSGSAGRSLKDKEAAEAIAAMVSETGLVVEPEFPAFERWVEQIYTPGGDGPQSMYIGHGNELLDPVFTAGLYFTCDGEVSEYCKPEVDKLIAEAGAELDEGKRVELYKQLWQILYDDAAFVSIANIESVHGIADNVSWTPRSDGLIILDEFVVQ